MAILLRGRNAKLPSDWLISGARDVLGSPGDSPAAVSPAATALLGAVVKNSESQQHSFLCRSMRQ